MLSFAKVSTYDRERRVAGMIHRALEQLGFNSALTSQAPAEEVVPAELTTFQILLTTQVDEGVAARLTDDDLTRLNLTRLALEYYEGACGAGAADLLVTARPRLMHLDLTDQSTGLCLGGDIMDVLAQPVLRQLNDEPIGTPHEPFELIEA